MVNARKFVGPADLTDLIRMHFGSDRRLAGVERLTGGSKKGVYRLTLDDGSTVVLYAWHPDENYWPDRDDDATDPFADASGLDLFEAAARRLTTLGVRNPTLYVADRSHDLYPADIALVEDIRGGKLGDLIARDRRAADRPLVLLREALDVMRDDESPSFGKVAMVESGDGVSDQSAATVILRHALADLEESAEREPRIRGRQAQLASRLQELCQVIRPRDRYSLVHGELGPDHVIVDDDGAPAIIDIEGLAYFDVEWEHVFLRIRFHDDHAVLTSSDLDPDRMQFYRLARHLSLVAGPLRIADVADFHDVASMREIAAEHAAHALAFV